MLVTPLVYLLYGYAFSGMVFGLYFIIRGAARLDTGARQMSVAMRLLLLPGSVALWPLLLIKLITRKSCPPHSDRRTG
jgi:hypothetical protein